MEQQGHMHVSSAKGCGERWVSGYGGGGAGMQHEVMDPPPSPAVATIARST
jgi:hypothetical protein